MKAVASAIIQRPSMNNPEKKRPLLNQTALVTHATTDIGAAIAEALADAGAKVMINYLDERDKAERLAEHIRNNHGQAMMFRADISQENELNSMLDVLMAYWGWLDILVNNAGLHQKTINQLTCPESPHENISLNLTMQLLRVRRVITPPSNVVGKIICVSATDICSKEVLSKLLDTLTPQLSEQNIRVNGILAEKNTPRPLKNSPLPGQQSALLNSVSEQQDHNASTIAKMVVRLVSDETDYRNGEILN